MPAPQEIGPYRIVRPLGQGGMGAVYLAYDTRLGRQVALKLFSGSDARSEYARAELLREARAAASLNHPHIASVHDVLDVDGQVGIVFEYVEGETLLRRIQRGRLSVSETITIAMQLADALAAAHQRGVVHRDLKPANVAITPEGVVKVLDFGVARAMPEGADNAEGARTTSAGFVGTVGYAAPEQCLSQSVDARADVFSLGVVMFEMLTGERPFAGKHVTTVLRAMVTGDVPRVQAKAPEVSRELDELIARMVAPDPDKRPVSSRQVEEELRGLAHASTASLLPQSGTRRNVVIAAVLVAAAVTTGLVMSMRASGAPPASAPTPVVAVLPLTNASEDPAKEFLAVGVADGLVTRLASVPSITVLSRATVADAARRANGVSALASELGAAYLVGGSVQQANDVVRVALNVFRPDGAVVWAHTAEGTFNSIFTLQTKVASALVEALSVQMSAADRASLAHQPTMNAEALAAYWRGKALLERRDVAGNIDAALAAFDEAVRLDPRFADAHAGRGEALWASYGISGEAAIAQAAIAANTDALRFGPNRAEVRYLLALTLAGTGRFDDAVEELQHALLLRPNFDEARRELAETLARLGRVDEAVAEVRKAIALRPGYWGHYNTLGRVLLQAARYPEAAAAFQSVVQLQPDSYIGHAQLGVVQQMLGQHEDALIHYARALELGGDRRIYSNVGAIHHQRGEYGKAVDAYRQVLRVHPNTHIAERNLGDALARLGREREAQAAYDRALRIADTALKVNPNNAETVATRAVYLAKLRRCDDAQAAATRAETIAPDDPRILHRQAAAYALCGLVERAMEAATAAIKRGLSARLLEDDEDLTSLRVRPEFRALLR